MGFGLDRAQAAAPSIASHAPGCRIRGPVLGVMPDPAAAVRHEWQAHGTCTGLSADAYFELVRRAFASIHIPRQFLRPAVKCQPRHRR